jgi:hypothetical protein
MSMSSSIRGSLWMLPNAVTQPDLWVSWDPERKRPGFNERWKTDEIALKPTYMVCDAIEQQRGRQLGIARVMRGDIVALDLDKVVGTPRDEETLVDWAYPIVQAVLGHGYLEWSHSGYGMHLLLCDVPEAWQKKRMHRMEDGSGWDWIIGDNLCHITIDVVSDENHRQMVPASTIIPLLEAMLPMPTPRAVVMPTTTTVTSSADRLHRYGEVAMEKEIDVLSSTIEGGRNNALNKAAFALGQLYAGGCIANIDSWTDTVVNMALAIGLDARAVRATFNSGFTSGQTQPRKPLDRPERRPTLAPRKGPSEAPQSTKPASPVSSYQSPPETPQKPAGAAEDTGQDQTTFRVAPDGTEGGITLAELQHKHIDDLRWVVEDIAPEGALLIAAKPKAKKSWLALNLGLAIAMGGRALGRYNVLQGDVLYLDLEGNQRRIQSRVRQILGVEDVRWPANFHVHIEWGVGDACINQLREWLLLHPATSAIVVDLLHEVRPPIDPRADRYAYDRDMLVALNKLAEAFHVCIMIIHHTRKMKGDDVFDEISGTLGITSAVSTIWMLSKAQDGTVTLNLQGRDLVHDESLALEWDPFLCGFRVSGLASEVAVSDTRRRIVEFLDDDQQHSPKQIAEGIEASVGSVDQQLRQLLSAGVVEKVGYGRWRLIRRAQ